MITFAQVVRLTRDLRSRGLPALRFNLTKRTRDANLLLLMSKLMPQDCGKNLIRMGKDGDGGYLIPDDLEGIEYCFSPGVNTISNFENDLADRNIRSFLADYSVDSPPVIRPEFVFDKKFLGSTDSGNYFTLASWKDKYLRNYTGDLILQMDIEGGEYEVIMSTPNQLLAQFRIVVIEFHSLDKLLDPFAFAFMSSCFEKLLEHFCVAHIHPNTSQGSVRTGHIEVPRTMEFTFLNKRRVGRTTPQRVFPHRLDQPNEEGTRLNLPECWYAKN